MITVPKVNFESGDYNTSINYAIIKRKSIN